jgi:hypothetical protein
MLDMRTLVFDSHPLATSTASTDLVHEPTPIPIDCHPVAVYLASLAPGSRRTMRAALRAIASIVDPTADELSFPF